MPKVSAAKQGKAKPAASAASKTVRQKFDKKSGKSGKSVSKVTVVDWKSQASTDYPFNTWDSAGRKQLDKLNQRYQQKASNLTKYELFLMQTWLPEQRKKFEQQQRRAVRVDKVGLQADKEFAKKRKQRRATDRLKQGMTPEMRSEDEDDVYQRRGATVRFVFLYLSAAVYQQIITIIVFYNGFTFL